MVKKMKFKYSVVITYDNKCKKCKGYYDSGNTLVYNMKPVIFYNGVINGKVMEYDVVAGNGTSKYINGTVYVNNKKANSISFYIRKQPNKNFFVV